MEITNRVLIDAARNGLLQKLGSFNIAGKVEVGFWLLDLQDQIKKAIDVYNSIIEKMEEGYSNDIMKLENGESRIVGGEYVFHDADKRRQFREDQTQILDRVVAINADKLPLSLLKDEIKDLVVLGFLRPLIDKDK